jgi:hypothetical protein
VAARQTPPKEVLHTLLKADFNLGRVFWLPRDRSRFSSDRIHKSWNSRFADSEAFTSIDGNGYYCGRLLEVRYMRHRILWKMAHGYDPVEVDHINRTPKDNRLTNLREATRSENNINRALSRYNTSGHVGVYKQNDADGQSWIAQIKRDGVSLHLGRFGTVDEAVAARAGAEAVLARG